MTGSTDEVGGSGAVDLSCAHRWKPPRPAMKQNGPLEQCNCIFKHENKQQKQNKRERKRKRERGGERKKARERKKERETEKERERKKERERE